MEYNRTPKIILGSLVTARRETAFCLPGESGVCFATRQVSFVDSESEPGQSERLKEPGYSFIFQGGGYDGFSPDQVRDFLEVTGLVSKDVADYQFKDVGQLEADWRSRRFDKAFAEQNIEKAIERSAAPPLRDTLRREYDENLKREAYGLEPRRGPDFDMDK